MDRFFINCWFHLCLESIQLPHQRKVKRQARYLLSQRSRVICPSTLRLLFLTKSSWPGYTTQAAKKIKQASRRVFMLESHVPIWSGMGFLTKVIDSSLCSDFSGLLQCKRATSSFWKSPEVSERTMSQRDFWYFSWNFAFIPWRSTWRRNENSKGDVTERVHRRHRQALF